MTTLGHGDRLMAEIIKRLDSGDDDSLFTGGCCFYFAMCAHKRGLGKLVYSGTSADPTKKGHAFVITGDGRAFDYNGYTSPSTLVFKFTRIRNSTPRTGSLDEVEREIAAQRFPAEVTKRIFARANEIITKSETTASAPWAP